MKERKFIPMVFNVYDCDGMERFFEKQAENGWMLEKVNALGAYFIKCEPKKVKFSVNFLPKGSMFESEKSEKYEDFKELSEHNGWKLISVKSPHMFFCAEHENPLPIETDPVLKVKTVHNAVKRIQLPLEIFWAVICLLNIFAWGFLLIINGVGSGDTLVDLSRVLAVVFPAGAEAFITAEIVRYIRWHKKAQKLAEEDDEFLSPKGGVTYLLTACLLSLAGMAFGVLSTSSAAALPYVFAAMLFVLAAVAVLYAVSSIMKKLNASEKTNRAVFIVILAIICAASLAAGIVFGALSA